MIHTTQLGSYTLESTRPLEGGPRVAIVGSRDCDTAAEKYAIDLAGMIAKAGGIVVSGGARGIDGAAHRGALEVNGKTWVVAPHGRRHVSPLQHADLFDDVAGSQGAMIWPFPPNTPPDRQRTYHPRNRVLVALSDAIVVVQAVKLSSGTRKTASYALEAGKPLWVVPLPPWIEAAGSIELLRRRDIRPLWRTNDLLASVGLRAPTPLPERTNPHETKVLAVLTGPLHRDHIAEKTGLTMPQLSHALLGLQLAGLVRDRMDGRVERLV